MKRKEYRMDFQDITTHQLFDELAKRYKHFGFVGVPEDEDDAPICHSAVIDVVHQLMVRFITEPHHITGRRVREEGRGAEHDLAIDVPPPEVEQVALLFFQGLAKFFPEFIFAGNPEGAFTPPMIVACPDVNEADEDQIERLSALRDALDQLPPSP
jgi:hypothetical protein